MSLTCPVCALELHGIANRTGTAAVCGRCGGIWLDNVSSRSVIQNFLEPSVKHTAREADAHVAQQRQATRPAGYRDPAVRPPNESAPRGCAECGAKLAQSLFEPAQIVLDVCASHGTWFDAGELWAMTQHFDMKAAMEDADAVAFGQEMQAYRNRELVSDFRAAGMLVGFLRR